MIVFEDLQDVEEWLEALDYLGFWDAVEPYRLVLQDRDHCDGLIASGHVPQDLVLSGLKALARMELRQVFGLEHRTYAPQPPTRH